MQGDRGRGYDLRVSAPNLQNDVHCPFHLASATLRTHAELAWSFGRTQRSKPQETLISQKRNNAATSAN